MALKIYRDSPFNLGTEVELIDTFVGDGITVTFPVINKVGSRVGPTIQYDNIQVNRYNGGFSISGNNVIFADPPPNAAVGVIPGINNVLVSLLFDQDNVDGLTNPRVLETPFWLADPDTIEQFQYDRLPSLIGIQISVKDSILVAGAATSWCQLACSTTDEVGVATSYLATGVELYTGPLDTQGTVAADEFANASSVTSDNASDFQLGDYIKIGSGLITQEIVKIIGFEDPNKLLITGTDNAHDIGEYIFTCGRKFWLKTTVPLNAVDGIATNLYDLGIRRKYVRKSRF
jgi:hypothetical protein